MAPTEGRVAKPEQQWGYRHNTPGEIVFEIKKVGSVYLVRHALLEENRSHFWEHCA